VRWLLKVLNFDTRRRENVTFPVWKKNQLLHLMRPVSEMALDDGKAMLVEFREEGGWKE
jgi:hypothetical protein